MADEPTPTPAPVPAPPLPADPAPTPLSPAPAPDPALPSDPAPTATDWRAGITDDDARKEAERSTDLNHFARRVVDMRKQLSTVIVKPGKDAPPEQLANFRKAMGIPETPEGYKFPDLPEGQAMTDEIKADRADWAKAFHDAGLPAETAERLIAKFGEKIAAQQAVIDAEDRRYAEESTNTLRQRWGGEFEVNKTHAQRAIEQLAQRAGVDVEELRHIETKDGRFLFDHPAMLQIFAPYGREMTEGNLGPAVTADQRSSIEGQIRDLRDRQDKAKGNRDNAEANRLYQEEQRLIAQLHGNRPVVGAAGRAA